MHPPPIQIEIAVDSSTDALAAATEGADRLEVCARLDVGGLTPSLDLLCQIRKDLPVLPLVAMVRAPGGDHRVSDATLDGLLQTMVDGRCGLVQGFIFGFIEDSRIDLKACHALRQAAADVPCIFHRAFDDLEDQFDGIESLIALGFRRVLTSGGIGPPSERLERLHRIAHHAAHRIEILPGGGIRAQNAAAFASIPGVRWVHSSCRSADAPERFSAAEFTRLRASLDSLGNDRAIP